MQNQPKTIVITGAAKGIGKSIAQTLAGEGQDLILIDKNPIETDSFRSQGSNITTYQTDLTKQDEIEDLVNNLQRKFTKIDILINNAGIGIYKSIRDLTTNEWELALKLNVTAPFLLTKLLLPSIKNSPKPLVINIGSGCGKVGVANRSAYCASKFGLRGLSLSLYEELKPNIPVVYLALGSVATEFGHTSVEEKLKCPNKNYLTTEEVSKKILEIINVATTTPQKLPPEIEYYPKGYFETLGMCI
ncbi:SDR family oxidoreductase [Patescibacteria group bacterium]|nr:SDR family oxidoreductase [Patescibacteria group bacterium]